VAPGFNSCGMLTVIRMSVDLEGRRRRVSIRVVYVGFDGGPDVVGGCCEVGIGVVARI
jgi:hypothetical protein